MKVSTGDWTQAEPNAKPLPEATASVTHADGSVEVLHGRVERKITRHGARIHSRHDRRAKPRHTWKCSAPVPSAP